MKEANENKKKKLSMTHQFVRFESYTHISFSNEFLMFTFYIDINKKMINLVSFNRADWFFFSAIKLEASICAWRYLPVNQQFLFVVIENRVQMEITLTSQYRHITGKLCRVE